MVGSIKTIIKTIVNVDLKGYTFGARLLQDQLSAHGVSLLDQQIQGLIDDGLGSIGAERSDVVLRTTGDGAILAFNHAVDAHRFAVGLHQVAQQHNAGKGQDAQRWFRVGIATGEVCLHTIGLAPELAGTVRIDAARLEGAGEAGEILIDDATFRNLPRDLQGLYYPEEPLTKHGEYIAAHCYTVLTPEWRPKARISGPALEEVISGWQEDSNLNAPYLTSLDDALVAGLALPLPVRNSAKSTIKITGTAANRLVFIGSRKEARRIVMDFLIELVIGDYKRRDPTERAWTYYTLGQLGGESARAALLSGAKNDEGFAASAARKALAALEQG